MSANRACTATFTAQFILDVQLTGLESRTVTSSPPGINCGSDCSEPYNSGTVVNLTATPMGGSVFAGWTGDSDCADGSVTMNSSKTCIATFNALFTLYVGRTGSGSGTVTSNPSGIDCGGDCSEVYVSGTVVTLTASPAPGSMFTAWSGDPDCTDGSVTMFSGRTCTATFDLLPPGWAVLTMTLVGNGTGTVTTSPPGITCPADCNEAYSSGTLVGFNTMPGTGSYFAGFGGDPDCLDGAVTMAGVPVNCTVTFMHY